MDSTHPTAGGDGGGMSAEDIAQLKRICRHLRTSIINTVARRRGRDIPADRCRKWKSWRRFISASCNIDPSRPDWPERDRFILSKGHASPGYYCTLAYRGYFPEEKLAEFDAVDSMLQGHPSRLHTPGVDMSTGSLGQGLSAAAGMAIGRDYLAMQFQVYVLLGDGEFRKDKSGKPPCSPARTGSPAWWPSSTQRRAIERHGRRHAAAGTAGRTSGGRSAGRSSSARDMTSPRSPARWAGPATSAAGPVAVIAHTVKGKGVSFMEGKYQWHGRAPNEEERRQAVAEIEQAGTVGLDAMKPGDVIEQRAAFGDALLELGAENPAVIVFDADVGTSTCTARFREAFPKRFVQAGIAEQNMVGMAAGASTLGLIPWVSTFAVFLAKRAVDQVRVSVAYAQANVKLNGAYGGIPTGKAGATHQSVEDVAVMRCMPNMTVLCPGDPLETRLAVRAATEHRGPVYLRTVRCGVPVIFDESHHFEIGRSYRLHEGTRLDDHLDRHDDPQGARRGAANWKRKASTPA